MLAVRYALQDVDVFHLESASAGAAARQPSPRQILHEVEWTQRDGLLSRSRRRLVGLGRLELPTSPLSGARSSHLSYRPNGNAENNEPDFIISRRNCLTVERECANCAGRANHGLGTLSPIVQSIYDSSFS